MTIRRKYFSMMLLILGCRSVELGTPPGENNDDTLKFAGTVSLAASANPARAKESDEVTLTLTLSTTRPVAVDAAIAVADPSGKQVYTGAWSSLSLSPSAPLSVSDSLVIEAADPVEST